MPQNAFFLRTRDLSSDQPQNDAKTPFVHVTLHPLSTVIFATATILAFALLRNSNFNFHCYTQREATPTQKSARKCAATSRDFFRERLQSAFTLVNQLRWIAQQDAPKRIFSANSRSSGQPKNDTKTLFSTLHPLFTVIFTTAVVLAFVLLRDSRFNFHCYTQHEATPTQKSARKCAATSRDFFRERLQSAFTLANQLRWIAQ